MSEKKEKEQKGLRLWQVQNEIGAIKRDSDNPYFKSKYFDINAILREVKPILNKHGFTLTQPTRLIEGKNVLMTMVIDAESGQSVLTGEVLLPDGLDPQKMGSAITYYRRYSLQTLLALEAEDDDGNMASNKEPVKTKVGVTADEGLPF